MGADRAASRSGKPLAALVSQGIVAGSSLLLQLIALERLGEEGLGRFALLFGILITVNSIQSGWLGDSLTVLDRFDPGIRRTLVQSQLAILVLVVVVTASLASLVDGVDDSTALLFGLASGAWVFEETIRRLLIARRDFGSLVVNDAAFTVGSFGYMGVTIATGSTFRLDTLVIALIVGAGTAIAVGVVQLPRRELVPGRLAPSRFRTVASFAVWRAAQIGLRPGSLAIVRTVVVAAASFEALGRLEAARLLLAPVLTIVNGAGVYLLPTYSAQAKRGVPFRPQVPRAMALVGGAAAVYGAIAIVAREPLAALLTDTTTISVVALVSWTAFSIGFGAGVPAGNALVAHNRPRAAFGVRMIDAAVGIAIASALAVGGSVDAVPLGLAAGTAVGATLLLTVLRRSTTPVAEPEPSERRVFRPAPTPMFERRGLNDTRPAPGPPPSVPTHRRRRVRHARRWMWLVPLVAIVATEYKVRRRDIDDALGGSLDVMILVELMVYGGIGLWAFWHLAPTTLRLTPLTVLMWGYILSTAVSSLYSTFPMLALARGVQLVIIGAAVHLLATDGRMADITRLVHGWIVLMTASIAMGLAYVAPTSRPQEGRFTWLFVHSVSAGSMLALSVAMLFGLWLSSGRRDHAVRLPWPRWIYGLLLVVQATFLLATRTRGSIGGCFIALAIMAWVWTGRRAKPQLVLGGLIAGAASLLAFGGPVIAFLTRGESAERIGTFNRRTEIWVLAWESFLDRPLHGLGFTAARGVFFDETGLGGAHNAFINVMIDVGLIGLVWWGLLLGAVVVTIARLNRTGVPRDARRRPGATGSVRSDQIVLIGLFATSVINGITTEGLGAGVNVSAIWLYLMVAWLCVLRRETGQTEASTTPSSLAKYGIVASSPDRRSISGVQPRSS